MAYNLSAQDAAHQASALRIAELTAALYRVPEFQACTRGEKRIALSQWLAEDLWKGWRPRREVTG